MLKIFLSWQPHCMATYAWCLISLRVPQENGHSHPPAWYTVIRHFVAYIITHGKVKVFPLQIWAGPRGSRRLRLRIFSTFGTMKVESSSPLRTGRLYPQEFSWYSFLQAESTPGHMVPSIATEKSPATPLGIDPKTLRLVAQCLNHYATPGPPTHNSGYILIILRLQPLRQRLPAYGPTEMVKITFYFGTTFCWLLPTSAHFIVTLTEVAILFWT
jgi:hypothetical protein